MVNTGLYIHVPFCIKKCPYCDFYSAAGCSESEYGQYTSAVIRNIQNYLEKYPEIVFDTVYFGGGTPSVMPVSFFRDVLESLKHNLDDGAEITAELNPGTAGEEKLAGIRQSGVNRLSLGIQSAVDSELRDLGRIHNFREAETAVSLARKAGFSNISGDLMTGIKGQTEETLMKSVNALADLELDHISSYMLKIEQGTEYFRNGISSEVPDEEKTAELYLLSVKTLADRGYHQYEISNFSRPGYESRHNLKYWHCDDYIGIGPSAHSCFGGKRYEVPRDLSKFIKEKNQQEIINEDHPCGFFEKAMLALRLTEGIDLNNYPEEAPSVLKQAEKLAGTGLVKCRNGVVSLTAEGFLLSNEIISRLLADF
ncbi:radical SAM family heme chaperone HemW [Ruminococcus sp. HUN007]|uniref:radical SAM family heme chaperone HemW n=1 Tax=Ruminococcus sp. HUN007 TaxID=1514668 RepID=UPI000678C76A|nr:radical SAM family heme chaperone HemW [Ruminococcus sp. HUN007]